MDELYQLFPFSGYKVSHLKIGEKDVRVFLDRKNDKPLLCHRCGTPLKGIRNKQRRRIEDLRMLEKRTFVTFTQCKGRCPTCCKTRLESIDFVSLESPALTKRYAFLLAQLCEIAPVSRAAELMGHNKMTLWRADLERMRRLFEHYRVPQDLTHLSVDEVYAKGHHEEEENRSDRFFTIITDLKSRKPVWIEQSRSKEALDAFFAMIGEERCAKIQVVATDQHEEYSRSIREYCPNAVQVFDRFHLMRIFEEAVNDARKRLYKMLPQNDVRKLAKGKYRFVFLKAASKRTPEEAKHIAQVMKDNEAFYTLELIKERMISFFDENTAEDAEKVFMELKKWIWDAGVPELKRWWLKTAGHWETIVNYFTFRVTTAVSEGVNNVIKSLKRSAFGYRNMEYFRLKILQRCGYLNSKYMTENGQWTPAALSLMETGA
jgi:transposase